MKKWAISFLTSFLFIAILLPSYWVAIFSLLVERTLSECWGINSYEIHLSFKNKKTENSALQKVLSISDKGSKRRINDAVQLINCSKTMSFTCPKSRNNSSNFEPRNPNSQSCPDYFRWIHEDLKPWKNRGITQQTVEKAKEVAHFRLVIVNGKAYVEKYKQPYQTRDVLTLWGILQLMKMYPGKLPDLDIMFQCGDKTVIEKKDYQVINDSITPIPPPVFHYCGDDSSLDIVFPDWTFWGWTETYIRPWSSVIDELEEANNKIKWIEREPYAFWKGNLLNGHRDDLAKCNSTEDWNAQIYNMDWDLEAKEGFRDAKMARQCMRKYKIYMEGNAWSVSRKYIMACNSMTLVVNPVYYDFFSRSLIASKHYWPIDADQVCKSIKFAVDWGNKHPKEAEEIGRAGSKFIQEEVKMKYVYDYMYHLLNEYAKLLNYKPSIPRGAIELCSETLACARNDTAEIEETYKLMTLVDSEAQEAPCSIPSPYDPQVLAQRFTNISKQVLQSELS